MADGDDAQAAAAEAAGASGAAGAAEEDRLIVVGGTEDESLQDRFLRFKKERQRERALAKRCLQTSTVAGVRDTERLRERFVEVCRGYVGVPYGRKHHTPDEPEYGAPLFLDCCALVRRAVQDLQEDFGFKVGGWNQAYQFETLPIELTFEQLRPGDLIFAEGVYYQEDRKPQRHNMVHVEVFIGGDTGEATIGSRWSKSDPAEGKVRGVQIHPSYRYVSKKYEIKRFHFRSLETWLQGTCRSSSYADAVLGAAAAASHCGGRSVFADDEGASGDEEESGEFLPDPYRESPIFFVGEGNNWKAVASALEQRGWRRLPFEADFSTRFDLKWVQQTSRIDFARHVEGQLVNHIPNNSVITSKAKFLETVRAHEAASGQRFPWHPASFCTERSGDKEAALAAAEAEAGAAWILKPARGNGGRGIELVRGAEALRRHLHPPPRDLAAAAAEETADQDIACGAPRPPPVEGWVVQRYVEDPLLLQGRKFDVRAYCLVARTTPHLWLFHPGYCKVALQAYDPSDLGSRYAHLTNACVQREHPDAKERRGGHIWSLAEAETELRSTGRWDGAEGSFWPEVHKEMKRVLAWLYRASSGLLQQRRGYFDLLGVDFLLDEKLGLHLLEVNTNPALFFECSPTLEDLMPRLIGATLDTVLEAQRPRPLDATRAASGEAADPSASDPSGALLGAFEPLVDEARGYVYDEAAAE